MTIRWTASLTGDGINARYETWHSKKPDKKEIYKAKDGSCTASVPKEPIQERKRYQLKNHVQIMPWYVDWNLYAFVSQWPLQLNIIVSYDCLNLIQIGYQVSGLAYKRILAWLASKHVI